MWRQWRVRFKVVNQTTYTLWRRSARSTYEFYVPQVYDEDVPIAVDSDPYRGHYDPDSIVVANRAAGLDTVNDKRLVEIPPGGEHTFDIELGFRSKGDGPELKWSEVRGFVCFEPKEAPSAGSIRIRWRRDFPPKRESMSFKVDGFQLRGGSLGALDCPNARLKDVVTIGVDDTVSVPISQRGRPVVAAPRVGSAVASGALRVIVRWKNPSSPLLPDALARVTLTGEGGAVTLTRSAAGEREFSVAQGTKLVALSASFTARLGPVKGTVPGDYPTPIPHEGPQIEREVLAIGQRYTIVNDTRMEAVSDARYSGPHPLTSLDESARRPGIVTLLLDTTFVDIEPFWAHYGYAWPYFQAVQVRRERGAQVVVLGHTGGSPLIWFAIVPNVMRGPTNREVSCLVFYRPSNYIYQRVDQPHNATAINRYFFAPMPDGTPDADPSELDHHSEGRYHYLRCGFERALRDSKRAVVMLHPWPSGGDFGAATWAVTRLADASIRYLHAAGLLGTGVAAVTLGRLGLSAFSAGGVPLWQALAANARRIDELYCFDPNSMNAHTLVSWFRGRPGACLRITGGAYGLDAAAQVFTALHEEAGDRLTAFHRDESEWAPGANPVFEHNIHRMPQYRTHKDVKHQFAVAGGVRDGAHGEVSFLRYFLERSAFNRG